MTDIKSNKECAILFEPKEREIDKNLMFSDNILAQSWRDFIQNYFTRSLLSYDVDKAKAYKELLSDIKSLARTSKNNIIFK